MRCVERVAIARFAKCESSTAQHGLGSDSGYVMGLALLNPLSEAAIDTQASAPATSNNIHGVLHLSGRGLHMDLLQWLFPSIAGYSSAATDWQASVSE